MVAIKLPPTVKINDKEVQTETLKESSKKILADLIKLDEELFELEFSVRKVKAAKNELQRLFTQDAQN